MGVLFFSTTAIIRLSQPSLAVVGAGAKLGNKQDFTLNILK